MRWESPTKQCKIEIAFLRCSALSAGKTAMPVQKISSDGVEPNAERDIAQATEAENQPA